MDGYKAFKFHVALKLHFTQPNYNVFVTKGAVRGSRATFEARNDKRIYERLARDYSEPKVLIQYLACNLMYGNDNVIYDHISAEQNHAKYKKIRQSISYIFKNDLETIRNEKMLLSNGIPSQDIIQLMMAQKITFETVAILNEMTGFIKKIDPALRLLIEDELLRIQKAPGFIRYDSKKLAGMLLLLAREDSR